ncbi:hypothetical protein L1281_002517 [Neisseria sp. HSC-16F19]|nr:hypothetical protein [Neisseria sp. HSC-16F19]MCP2041899.1 hypothetical protein [Neisseria sp. HSC-16F19]
MNCNIGYMSPDWGMEDYYRQLEEADAITCREERLREYYTDDCRAIALKTVKPYALANDNEGEDSYYQEWGVEGDTASWHDWLIEAAYETGCNETAETMALLIADEAEFTAYAWAIGQAEKQLPRKQAA